MFQDVSESLVTGRGGKASGVVASQMGICGIFVLELK